MPQWLMPLPMSQTTALHVCRTLGKELMAYIHLHYLRSRKQNLNGTQPGWLLSPLQMPHHVIQTGAWGVTNANRTVVALWNKPSSQPDCHDLTHSIDTC